MNILELPKELIATIGSYLVQNEDILRFGKTCQLFSSQSFNYGRSLKIIVERDFIRAPALLKDLSQVTKFKFSSYLPTRPTTERLFQVMERFSTLHNMRSLTLQLPGDPSKPENEQRILDVISKMTWLEELQCDLTIAKDSFDSSVSFNRWLVNHHRLTTLIVDVVSTEPNNFEGLTQLKHLTAATSDDHSVLEHIQKLTGLTSLDLSWSQTTREALTCLQKLTTLEALNVSGISPHKGAAFGSDWQIFASLPNLRALTDTLIFADHPPDAEYFSEFTRLTKLDLQIPGIASEALLGLTDLKSLTVRGTIQSNSINFASLANLTYLMMEGNATIEDISLPPRLKEFFILIADIPSSVPTRSFFSGLCNATTLERLEFSGYVDFEDDPLAEFITRLVNLRELAWKFSLPKTLCLALANLPALRRLEIKHCENCEDEVKQLTQLVELWLGGQRAELLREKIPFAVYNCE